MKKKRTERVLAIVGSSVSLYVRPPRSSHEDGTYGELIAREAGNCWRVVNLARVSYDVRDALEDFASELLPLSPDAIILHLGVNEFPSRLLPRSVWRFGNGGPARQVLRPSVARRAVVIADAALRRVATRIHPHPWYKSDDFADLIRLWLTQVRKEIRAEVIVVGTGVPTDRIERQLHGSTRRAREFDAILRGCAEEFPEATYVDLANIIETGGVANIQPDGIHLSARGHQALARALLQVLLATASRNADLSGSGTS